MTDHEGSVTRSGAVLKTLASTLREELTEKADKLAAIAEEVRALGREVPGVTGVLATCRSLAATIDGAVKLTREKADEVYEALTKEPRDAMPLEEIRVSIDQPLAQRAADAAREDRRRSA